MPSEIDKINELYEKLEQLSKKQALFQREINALREEIYALKTSDSSVSMEEPEKVLQLTSEKKVETPVIQPITPKVPPKKEYAQTQQPKQKSNLEKFIGENLINKIGILILVIGVAIGAKYSIDNELISPLTRIVLGYLVGFGLVGTAMKLKKDYLNLSAVLLSGAMAVMYFITFAAYSFYQLIPQIPAFGLMAVFTLFTVFAAIQYEKQVIAHIGLVGAYAIPFLLSNGSGQVAILFTYMAILNIGILGIAIKKYWKPLYINAFVITWLIFLFWCAAEYQIDKHFWLALGFLTLFFLIFYAVFLSYKLIQKEAFAKSDIIMVFLNASLFYGIGYAILNEHPTGSQLLGLFTLANAVLHFGASLLIHRQQLTDKNLFYLAMTLVLSFLTIAIPVQLEGHWVVLVWSIEAALMFWIGRTKEISFYERISYVLMGLASACLMIDATSHYHWDSWNGKDLQIVALTPILNPQFLAFIVFILSLAAINYFQSKQKVAEDNPEWQGLLSNFLPPTLLLLGIYFAFFFEISNYFHQAYNATALAIKAQDYFDYYGNEALRAFNNLSLMNYSLLFLSVLAFINLSYLKNSTLAKANLALAAYTVVTFLMLGMTLLSDLREMYLHPELTPHYTQGSMNIGIRYVSYLFVGIALFAIYKHIRTEIIQPINLNLVLLYDVLLFGTILWVASSELITWVEMSGSADSFKLGLSVLWGIYSLLLISLGIAKKKKHLRLGAIGLFAITLLKLFFYDISNLSTIAKVLIFISLGILLLLISFLYTKYKHLIFDEEDDTSK
ncbi:MAG: DUF2339 domain-containing protein [Bacteroidia bacterium]